MRRYSSSLPTLALFVNVVCLLMVLVLKSVHCVKLYNDCSSQNIAVDRKGRVCARDDLSKIYQNLTVKSIDFTGKLTIFGEESRRYLCFNKNWKLVGWTKYRGISCLFYEEMLKNGYTRYRSVRTDSNGNSRFIGFNKRGKLMKETREQQLSPQLRKCLNFLKLDNTDFSISNHNRKVAGLKENVDFTLSKIQNFRLNLTSQDTPPYVYKSSHHVKIRHKNHHHQSLNEIT